MKQLVQFTIGIITMRLKNITYFLSINISPLNVISNNCFLFVYQTINIFSSVTKFCSYPLPYLELHGIYLKSMVSGFGILCKGKKTLGKLAHKKLRGRWRTSFLSNILITLLLYCSLLKLYYQLAYCLNIV